LDVVGTELFVLENTCKMK